MKRDFLKELGIAEEAIDKIMAENGRDIQNAKGEVEKTTADLEQTKAELKKANETLDKFKDYDNVKSEVQKYKDEAAKSKTEFEQKIAQMERVAKIKDFTSSKKFVNDFTRDSINNLIDSKLSEKDNKKSIEELFKELTDGKSDILKAETAPVPPKAPSMSNNKDEGTDDEKVRRVMGLPPKN